MWHQQVVACSGFGGFLGALFLSRSVRTGSVAQSSLVCLFRGRKGCRKTAKTESCNYILRRGLFFCPGEDQNRSVGFCSCSEAAALLLDKGSGKLDRTSLCVVVETQEKI